MPEPLPLTEVTRLPPTAPHLISVSLDGHALLLSPSGPGPAAHTLTEHDGTATLRSRELIGAPMWFPIAQTFASGEILAVDTRCQPGQTNAAVFSPDGALLTRFAAGDGVEHVRVDGNDDVWVAYFDEGIFGNDPLGPHGLNRFTKHGDLVWSFRPPHEDLDIADCYALNVAAADTWAYYYDGFPLARMTGDRPTFWRTGIPGGRAIAVSGDHVLLVGGYKENRQRALKLRLVGDLAITEAEYRLAFTPVQVIGVGATLHVFDQDSTWYQVDIEDL